MKFLKLFIFLSSVCLLQSCPVPRSVSFNYKALTPEMLNGTVWGGSLTTHPVSDGGFMAVRYANVLATVARGKTKEIVIRNIMNLPLKYPYKIDAAQKQSDDQQFLG